MMRIHIRTYIIDAMCWNYQRDCKRQKSLTLNIIGLGIWKSLILPSSLKFISINQTVMAP